MEGSHVAGLSCLPDPYQCRAQIWVDQDSSGISSTEFKDILNPLLDGIDPAYEFVGVNDTFQTGVTDIEHKMVSQNCDQENNRAFSKKKHSKKSRVKELSTPALAFVLFLNERGSLPAEWGQALLRRPPWEFHHKIELSNTRGGRMKCVARQEFYQPGSDLPLWAVCPVHTGNEHLRFTLFTRDYPAMVEFYSLLTKKDINFARQNFCCFELYSQPGLDIQLALKHCAQLKPRPSKNCCLRFKLPSMKILEPLLGVTPTFVSEGLFLIHDPDGNAVLVEETGVIQGVLTGYMSESTDQNNIEEAYSQIKMDTGYRGGTRYSCSSFDSGRHSSSFSSTTQTDTESELDTLSLVVSDSEWDTDHTETGLQGQEVGIWAQVRQVGAAVTLPDLSDGLNLNARADVGLHTVNHGDGGGRSTHNPPNTTRSRPANKKRKKKPWEMEVDDYIHYLDYTLGHVGGSPEKSSDQRSHRQNTCGQQTGGSRRSGLASQPPSTLPAQLITHCRDESPSQGSRV